LSKNGPPCLEFKRGCYVRSFVSDNESKMKKNEGRFGVDESSTNDDYSCNFFISYCCNAHYLHLVNIDVFKLPVISTTNANIG